MSLVQNTIMKYKNIPASYYRFKWLLIIKSLAGLTHEIKDTIFGNYSLIANAACGILIYKIDSASQTKQLIGMRHHEGWYDMDMEEIDAFIYSARDYFPNSSELEIPFVV